MLPCDARKTCAQARRIYTSVLDAKLQAERREGREIPEPHINKTQVIGVTLKSQTKYYIGKEWRIIFFQEYKM